MKKYPWITKIGKSLVPSEFYVHILQEPLRKAFGYIILFILLLSLVVGGYNSYRLKISFDQTLEDYDAGLIPDFKLQDGKLIFTSEELYTIPYFDVPILLDPKGDLSINTMLSYKDALIFAPDRFILIRDGINPMVSNYNRFQNPYGFDTTSSDMRGALILSSYIAIPIGIILQFVLSLFEFFFNSVFILLMANILRSILGLGLKLKQLYHMTIYAMTFSVFWSHFTLMLPSPVPYQLDTFVYYVIPSLILMNVFIHIRKRAIEEINKNNK